MAKKRCFFHLIFVKISYELISSSRSRNPGPRMSSPWTSLAEPTGQTNQCRFSFAVPHLSLIRKLSPGM